MLDGALARFTNATDRIWLLEEQSFVWAECERGEEALRNADSLIRKPCCAGGCRLDRYSVFFATSNTQPIERRQCNLVRRRRANSLRGFRNNSRRKIASQCRACSSPRVGQTAHRTNFVLAMSQFFGEDGRKRRRAIKQLG
jgi:hypothetical protein